MALSRASPAPIFHAEVVDCPDRRVLEDRPVQVLSYETETGVRDERGIILIDVLVSPGRIGRAGGEHLSPGSHRIPPEPQGLMDPATRRRPRRNDALARDHGDATGSQH